MLHCVFKMDYRKDLFVLLFLCGCLQLTLGAKYMPLNIGVTKTQQHYKPKIPNTSNCICFDENVYPTLPQPIVKNNGVQEVITYLLELKNSNKIIQKPYLVRLKSSKHGNVRIELKRDIYYLIKYKPNAFNVNRPLYIDDEGILHLNIEVEESNLNDIFNKIKYPSININYISKLNQNHPDRTINNQSTIKYQEPEKPSTNKPIVIENVDKNVTPKPENIFKWNVISKSTENELIKPYQVFFPKKVSGRPVGQVVYEIAEPVINPVKIIYKNFEDWFQKNSIVLSLNISPVQLVNIRKSIEHILQVNGFYISQTGSLLDKNGRNLDPANLKLHPIIIRGQTYTDSLKMIKYGDSFYYLPEGLNYLQGLLIALANPSTLLGIISIKLTSTSTNVPDNQINEHYADDKMQHNKNPPIKYYQPEVLTTHSKITETRYICDSKQNCQVVSNVVSDTMPSVIDQKVNGLKNVALNALPDYVINAFPRKAQAQLKDQNADSRNSTFPTPSPRDVYLKNLLNHVANEKSSELTPFVDELVNVYSNLLTRQDGAQYNKTGEISPLYRIIGGNAATSSGTPVSMKGRFNKVVA